MGKKRAKKAVPEPVAGDGGLSPQAAVAVGLGTTLAGLVFAGFLVYLFQPGFASQSWPTTEGTVVRSWVDKSPSGREWDRKVQYGYTVDGKEYQGERLAYPEQSAGRGDKELVEQKLRSQYPAGGKCTVHYDPADPKSACLEAGPNYIMLGILAPACAVILLGGAIYSIVSIARLGGRKQTAVTRP